MSAVYLIPSQLSENGTASVHPYSIEAIKSCQVFFTENQRTARRFFKQLWKQYAPGEQIIIDDFEWFDLDDSEESFAQFRNRLSQNKIIGIISEAGCPGIADPGQSLVAIAHDMNIPVKPLVGPSAITLALMASGMNGQQFQFIGYLPIEQTLRVKAIKDLESVSQKKKITQLFIETPYRNNQLIDALLNTCHAETRLCIAVDITGEKEWIKTKTIGAWKKYKPDINKRPALFLLSSSGK